jgi:hypothetical protein
MLVLRRKEGQWIEITHQRSGDTLRIRVYNIRSRFPGQLDLAFDNPDRNFEIIRPERPPLGASNASGSTSTTADDVP